MLREGDIYRWSYRGPDLDRDGTWGRYHCCSRIAVVKNERLRDTFWSCGSDGRSFGVDDLPRLNLTLLGNFADLEKSDEHNACYYDDTDIVDLNHSNSTRGNFYLRKGAKRSQTKMLAMARYKLERAKSDERMAADRAVRLQETIAHIEAGRLDVYLIGHAYPVKTHKR